VVEKMGLGTLSEVWPRTRYRAMKAEGQLAELRGLLHHHFLHGSEYAKCMLILESSLHAPGEDVRP
jgi:hypothetical protein